MKLQHFSYSATQKKNSLKVLCGDSKIKIIITRNKLILENLFSEYI